MPRFSLPRDILEKAMTSQPVRQSLRKRARAIANRAQGLDQEFGAGIRVEEGTRPRGRPFARVIHDTGADMEFGTSKTARRRVLGRAADTRG